LASLGAFQSRASLEAENMILRHQLNVLRAHFMPLAVVGQTAPKESFALRNCLLIGPDADRRAKLLISQAVAGSFLIIAPSLPNGQR
jgi:hypothetical protein